MFGPPCYCYWREVSPLLLLLEILVGKGVFFNVMCDTLGGWGTDFLHVNYFGGYCYWLQFAAACHITVFQYKSKILAVLQLGKLKIC